MPVEILNLTRRPRRVLSVAPNGRVFKEDHHEAAEVLNATSSTHLELLLITTARGRHRLQRVAITTIYPLGFFRSWRYHATDSEYLVYPKPKGELPLPSGANATAEVSAGGGRGGDDYAGVKNYQLGESQRHVDWRAVARGQPLLVKRFAGAGSRRLWFDYAELSSLPNVEARLSQLCRWVLDAEKGAYSYGLRVDGFAAEPSRGPAHYHRCLEKLATTFSSPVLPPKPSRT